MPGEIGGREVRRDAPGFLRRGFRMGEDFRNEVDQIWNLYCDHGSVARFNVCSGFAEPDASFVICLSMISPKTGVSTFRDHALGIYLGMAAKIGGGDGFVTP